MQHEEQRVFRSCIYVAKKTAETGVRVAVGTEFHIQEKLITISRVPKVERLSLRYDGRWRRICVEIRSPSDAGR
jgi:hypothetical protein